MNTLHPYIGYAGDPSEGAVLVFAPTARAARRGAADTVRAWTDCNYIDVRARRLREHEIYLTNLANPSLWATDCVHVIESPPSCRRCDEWGYPIGDNGVCSRCLADQAADDVLN